METGTETGTETPDSGADAEAAAAAAGANEHTEFVDLLNNYVHDTLEKQVNQDEVKADLGFDKEKLLGMVSKSLKTDPAKLLNLQMQLFEKQLELMKRTSLSVVGKDDAEDIIKEAPGDARFGDKAWSDHPAFNFLKQSYLLNCNFIDDLVNELDIEDPKAKEQVEFAARQFSSSLSPTNFAGTNPEVCRATVETNGKNLVKGLSNFVEDLANSPPNGLAMKQTDVSAFEVGRNLAVTPGKVIYQNNMMQLIQYTPVTDKVYKNPLLLVPAFINKFYILDLDPKKSYVKWLLEQGFTVFMISWVNPDESMASIGFDDYMLSGPITALDVIEKVTGSDKINTVGYCIGGTLLSATQAYLKNLGDERIASATYLASLVDFSNPGQLGVFISDDFLASIEKDIDSKGYLDGRSMALSFNLLRENSLFWSFFIQNYLKGENPMALDMLYWNSDSTNFPKAAYSFYLRNMYLENRLIRPNGIEMAGQKINLSAITSPSYFISTVKDHIAPWEGCYKGALVRQGDTRFVLSGSGHIAGIVNHPAAEKYGYWTNDDLPGLPEQWQKSAEQHSGSWWNDWLQWVKPLSGKQQAALDPEKGVFPVIEDAPGSYVMKQCG